MAKEEVIKEMGDDNGIPDQKIKEIYVLLLIGCVNRSIKTHIHLQKELFLFSKILNPELASVFSFNEHNFGPYDSEVEEIIETPFYYEGAFKEEGNSRITLTSQGQKYYKELIDKNKDNEKFQYLLSSLKLLREIYDSLSTDEFLFLVYTSYPNFEKNSEIYNNLIKNAKIRKQILESLLNKGIISKEKYMELYSLYD
ncbi:hypothetical protein M1558_01990 [Candidatus Parvarchaeota archaeon]|jgi:hypothetical protein|nr:hypothetical protein [Candidatus Parvarchaeota archaeon]